ncbi:Lrp/AsnC ligand binding domain-containing protein [Halapricum desulfuricans]|uniref:Lrp/AsnC family C-terminal domain n=1 Tax=Halapricum desulfuricans TaxID=2841257 RepID=A0A897NUR8_9EURY|nr:Lrp/AsnC ligand binding domain-containing protein [Halapricum desulfuricans]QSG15275.1 Lrp/AsnC family C-terminal domain [Halapricum desulfuricans]
MVRAYVTIKTAAGKSEDLLASVRATDGVEEAHIVAGQYDIIAEAVEAEIYDVMESVASDIGALEGITDTRTYICLE